MAILAATAVILRLGSGRPAPAKKTVAPQEAVTQAKAILDQLDAHTDSRGFYGEAQWCTRTEPGKFDCELETLDYSHAGRPEASFRRSIAVAWARYMYWKHTGDSEQLRKMEADLKNLYDLAIAGDEYTLQTDSYNCLLMGDIALDENVSYESRYYARSICYDADFENHPESLLTYDISLNRIPYKQIDKYNNDRYSTEAVVVSDYDRVLQENEIKINDFNEVKSELLAMLVEYGQENSTDTIDTKVGVVEAGLFQRRELLAALDKLAELTLMTQDDEKNVTDEEISNALMEYLLLTKETFSWYALYGADAFEPEDNCLLYYNVRAFLDFMNIEERSVLSRIDKNNNEPYCMLTAYSFESAPVDKENLFNFIYDVNLNYSADDWAAGIFTNYKDEEFIWHVYPNALIAGMLMI